MIITNTKGRVRDYMNMQKEEREHAAPLVTEEGDSGVPLDLIEDIRDTSNSESDFQSLLKQVREYLYNRKERFGRVFDLLLEGRTGQEIQEALGVSRGYISQTMESIRKEIVTFARSIGNTELESAAEAIGKKYFVHSSDYIRRFSRFLKSHIECA
jgi:DNA-directed RNA polymerase specialized sigma subunit